MPARSCSPCASHQAPNLETERAYALRVFGLRIWAVKNSSVRLAAAGVGRNSAGNCAMALGRVNAIAKPQR